MKFHQYLLLLFLVFANQVIFAQDLKSGTISSTSFKVFGACDQCKNRIEKVLKIKGIKMANWDVDTQILALEYSPSQIAIEKIQNKILSVGHDLVDKKAKDIIYSELPDCCHYREEGAELVHEVSMATIKGVVLQDNANGKFEPLANATIHWLGATAGVVTDSLGVFAIQSNSITQRLIVSYAGYKADTITVVNANDLKIILATN